MHYLTFIQSFFELWKCLIFMFLDVPAEPYVISYLKNRMKCLNDYLNSNFIIWFVVFICFCLSWCMHILLCMFLVYKTCLQCFHCIAFNSCQRLLSLSYILPLLYTIMSWVFVDRTLAKIYFPYIKFNLTCWKFNFYLKRR